jgi:endonuclease YncB( thermonuclease family)
MPNQQPRRDWLRDALIGLGLAAAVVGGWEGMRAYRAPDRLDGQAVVLDGDSLYVNRKPVRLFGIDAPELGQSCSGPKGAPWNCGIEAKMFLERLVGREVVSCEVREHDVYDRNIAICKVKQQDLGRALVREGLAIAYRRYSDKYYPDEMMAVGAKRGMWAGKFQSPESFRREKGEWERR